MLANNAVEMDFIWILIATFVMFIALMKREWLFEREPRAVIFGITAALMVAGLIITAFTYKRPALFPSLANPMVSLGLFVVMHKGFVRWKKRDPVDTFMNWDAGLVPDRLFNILYFSLGFALMLLLYAGANLSGYKWH